VFCIQAFEETSQPVGYRSIAALAPLQFAAVSKPPDDDRHAPRSPGPPRPRPRKCPVSRRGADLAASGTFSLRAITISGARSRGRNGTGRGGTRPSATGRGGRRGIATGRRRRRRGRCGRRRGRGRGRDVPRWRARVGFSKGVGISGKEWASRMRHRPWRARVVTTADSMARAWAGWTQAAAFGGHGVDGIHADAGHAFVTVVGVAFGVADEAADVVADDGGAKGGVGDVDDEAHGCDPLFSSW
jgi:hypothetical protein